MFFLFLFFACKPSERGLASGDGGTLVHACVAAAVASPSQGLVFQAFSYYVCGLNLLVSEALAYTSV